MHRRPHWACLSVMLSAIAAGAESPPAWAHPVEAMQAKDERMPWPVEVVKGASGGIGVFVFEREVGLTLRISKDGKAPWKVILLPNGVAGAPVVDGDRVEIPLADEDAKSVSIAAFDLAEVKELGRTAVPGPKLREPSFSRLVASGAQRFLVVTTAAGDIFTAQTGEDGKTWAPLVPAGRLAARGGSSCPALLAVEGGPHLIYAAEDGKLVHRAPGDAGKDPAVVPAPAEEHGKPLAVAGSQDGRLFHLVVLTTHFRFLYAWSDDAGAHWGPWTVVASPTKESLDSLDIATSFRLRTRGNTSVLSWTERGERAGDPWACHFLVSRTGGSKWENFSPSANVRGSCGLTAVHIAADGNLTAAFACAPKIRTGNRYVLVRQTRPGPDPAAPPEAEWWGR